MYAILTSAEAAGAFANVTVPAAVSTVISVDATSTPATVTLATVKSGVQATVNTLFEPSPVKFSTTAWDV